MSRYLFLANRMKMGYGVSLAVHEISERLVLRGHEVTVGCLECDSDVNRGYGIVRLSGGLEERVSALADELRPDAIVSHTTPFFELLPVLRHGYRTWAWEYGDPTPQLFDGDRAERERIRRYKIEFCYPVIDGVIAISEFIRHDIEWPAADVVPLGCDHAPDFGSKSLADFDLTGKPLRIGTLMRLGQGESRYKGNDLFVGLGESLRESGAGFELCIMGRGGEKDARALRAAGLDVALNAGDDEKWTYLRGLDAFVSASLWEGFDLPLVEAQAVGTLGLAFDTGAHPETCPLVFGTPSEMATFLGSIARDRTLALRHSVAARRFVRSRFQWDRVVDRFEELLAAPWKPRNPSAAVERKRLRSTVGEDLASMYRSVRYEGIVATLRKVPQRLRERVQRMSP